jgi:hypothetical protein
MDVLESFDHEIESRHMKGEESMVQVEKDKMTGALFFRWTSPEGESSYFSLEKTIGNGLKLSYMSGEDYDNASGKKVIKKYAEETEVSKVGGEIRVKQFQGWVSKDNCEDYSYNATTGGQYIKYDENGIMIEKVLEAFPSVHVPRGNVKEETLWSMLSTPRNYFDPTFDDHHYSVKMSLYRNSIDIATMHYVDKENDHEYLAETLLDQGVGLRKMKEQDYSLFNNNVEILGLSSDAIEEMIQKEKDPKVQEGLRELSKGRATYYYSSDEDPHFTCKYHGEEKGKTR